MSEGAFAFGELLKLIVALGVTIGLFYALALFMKRMQVGTGRGGNLITVLAALPLGGKEKLWVVEVAGERLVVGTCPGSINCLHVLPKNGANAQAEPVTPTSSVAQAGLATPEPSAKPEGAMNSTGAGGFASLLQNFRGGEKS